MIAEYHCNMLREKTSPYDSTPEMYYSFSAFCKFHNVCAISAVFCFKIFPAALWMSFCHLFLVIHQLNKKIQYAIKVRNGLEMRGRFLTELRVSVCLCSSGTMWCNCLYKSRPYTLDPSGNLLNFPRGKTDPEIWFISVVASYQNHMYSGYFICLICLYEPPYWLSIRNRAGLYLNGSHFSWWPCLIDKNNLTRETRANK